MSSDEIAQKIISIIANHANPRQGLTNLKKNQNIVPGIVAIVTGAAGKSGVAVQVIQNAPVNDVSQSILKIIQNSIPVPSSVSKAVAEKLTAEGNRTNSTVQTVLDALKTALEFPILINSEKKPEDAIGQAYYGGRRAGWVFGSAETPKFRRRGQTNLINSYRGWSLRPRAGNSNAYNFYYIRTPSSISWPKLFSRKGNMTTVVGAQSPPNFMNAPINPITGEYKAPNVNSGYLLTTRNGKTGWWRNKSAAPSRAPNVAPARAPNVAPARAPNTIPVNYKNITIKELVKKRPINREAVKKLLETEINSVRYNGPAKRARRLGELLRILPSNFNSRRDISSLVINDIRRVRTATNLSNLRTNLGTVTNANVRRALDEQRRRLARRQPYENDTEYRRRRENEYGYRRRPLSPRRPNESIMQFNRRKEMYVNANRPRENASEMRRRREARTRAQAPNVLRNIKPMNKFINASAPAELINRNILPINQQKAINNTGGAPIALATVASVPGGAPEIAKAAEALNETHGNVSQAIYIKGASPAAVAAVQKLGGPNNTVHILEGLNTMSQTPATIRKKYAKRSAKKVIKPRITELNRVINSVRKQKLISLVAHNVTKTHQIHPNDEKLKKYYKKILKSNILRTPFAKIVKKAAKKNV